MTRRGSLGLLVDSSDEEYQGRIIAAADEVAQKHDRTLLCFVGGSLEPRGVQGNFVFELVAPEQVDGLILLGTLGNLVGPVGLAQFAARFHPLPLCSLGVALGGVPSILIDNARGMRALLLHLLDVHGLRRLAFIRGPEASEEAASRLAVYQDVLRERGIPLDPELVVSGDFVRESGMRAIRTLVDERHAEFDGVVASNDAMAFGAIKALTARGMRVPHDMPVAGFDDIAAARFSSPPLTTVRQPLRDQGIIAAEQLLAMLRGEPPPSRTVLRTQLVVRQSCGCPAPTAPSVAQYQLVSPGRSLRETLRQQRARVSSDLARAMRSVGATFELGWGERLVEAFEAELDGAAGLFPATLEELLETSAVLGGNVGAWHMVVSLLRHHARAAAELDPAGCARAEELWQDARVLVSGAAERAHARARIRTEDWVRQLYTIGERVHHSTSSTLRAEILGKTLPELGLRSAYVVAFDQASGGVRTSRLVVAFDSFGAGPLPRAGTPLDATELLPGGIARLTRRTSYLIEPLFSGDRPLGYALLELGGLDYAVYQAVRREISLALEPEAATVGPCSAVSELKASLVPARLSVEGFRVATFLGSGSAAATDYCEVLATEGGCWVALGQVLPVTSDAAAVALIIHGAMAALVNKHPSLTPRDLLATVNAVLYENLQRRLQKEQHAALVVIRCDPGGRMVFAGTGAPLLVCRSRDGRTVTLTPTGTVLGAVHDVSRSLEDIHCQLEPGDVLLAGTPALADARNAQGEPLGIARLASELEQTRTCPVEEIRDHLTGVLRDWVAGAAPDASWVVLRHGWEPPPRSRPGK